MHAAHLATSAPFAFGSMGCTAQHVCRRQAHQLLMIYRHRAAKHKFCGHVGLRAICAMKVL